MGMAMEKYVYFRTVADEDDDDAVADAVAVPVGRITGMNPTSDTAITIWFRSLYSEQGDAQSGSVVINDSVVLNVSQGKTANVLQTIIGAINATGPQYSDGFIVIADDTTTDYDGTTRSAVYIDGNITSCGAITVAAAVS
jgi:hypothetical protein